ncbi:unnamed protein product [Prorocentrum cordatum]|uniref:protein-tyrosine-phosphatase n=1 Tax=Prorocentrum cordatum TaxID=2364126 RepID=A0ABN9UR90_9DINO|nr:unnamed protein product [Polarella glacialis]
MRDHPSEDLRAHLPSAFSFLDEAKGSGGRCVVHCFAGVSRSPAVALAYLVVRERRPLADAWALVRERHTAARPNRGFAEQLVELDRETHGAASATLADFGFDCGGRGLPGRGAPRFDNNQSGRVPR